MGFGVLAVAITVTTSMSLLADSEISTEYSGCEKLGAFELMKLIITVVLVDSWGLPLSLAVIISCTEVSVLVGLMTLLNVTAPLKLSTVK